MSDLKAGQRIRYDSDDISFAVNSMAQIKMTMATEGGKFIESEFENGWHIFRNLADHGNKSDILVYMNETSVGHANDAYPISMKIGDTRYNLPKPITTLRSVIVAQLYEKENVRRLKVSNEGHVFGIDGYARTRNIPSPLQPPDNNQSHERDRDFPPAPPRGSSGSGSGVLIASNLVVTNAHVLEDARSFRIATARSECRTLAVDTKHDLALVEGDFSGEPLLLRIGETVCLGEEVIAAGFPLKQILGNDLKVTRGNVSGMRGFHGDLASFQFSAPIGSGSSGGAVVDAQGQIIGITSASLAHGRLRDDGATSENVNFAIKSCLVHELLASEGYEPKRTPVTDLSPRELTNRLRRGLVQIEMIY